MAAGGRPTSPPTGSTRARRLPPAPRGCDWGSPRRAGPGSPQAAPGEGPTAPPHPHPRPRLRPCPPRRRHVTGAHARRPGAHLQADVSGPRAVPRARLPRLPAAAALGLARRRQPEEEVWGYFNQTFLSPSCSACLPSATPLFPPFLSPGPPSPPNSDDIHMVFCTEEAAQEEGTHPHLNISLFFPPSSSPPLFLLERQNVQGDSLGELMASFLLPSQPVF